MPGAPAAPSWADRRVFTMALLGFASGLPWPLSGLTLRQWLSEIHAPLVLIGWTGSLGLAYSLKFLWAPLLDRTPPGPFAALGRRRGWLLPIQLALVAAILWLAAGDARHGLALLLLRGALIGLLSSCQDIVIDAWRIETFPVASQGIALAAYVWGYRIAVLAGGAGVIALATPLGWHGALAAAALASLVGIGATLLASEPVPRPSPSGPKGRFTRYLAPARELITRPGIALVLAYVLLFKLGEAMASVMLAPFYRALGFNRAEVALSSGPVSLGALILGYAAGSVAIRRFGLGRALLITGFAQAAIMGLYLVLAVSAGTVPMLVAIAFIESFAEGLADAAFLSFLSGLCAPGLTAGQYALLSSLATVPLRLLGGVAGWLAHLLGFAGFFAVASFASVPAMLVMLALLRWRPAILERAG